MATPGVTSAGAVSTLDAEGAALAVLKKLLTALPNELAVLLIAVPMLPKLMLPMAPDKV